MSAALDGLRPEPGVHCETTMLGTMLRHAGAELSEAMLLGLGEGIDAQYFPPLPGVPAPPMLTGRTGPGLIAERACAALGLGLTSLREADDAAAQARAVEALRAGRVVGVTVDIFHLDYFASRNHFSAHCVALHALDDTTAYVVDTAQQGGAVELPRESLARARASAVGFMPSPRQHWHLEAGPGALRVGAADLVPLLWPAVQGAAARFLDPGRGADRGIAALRRAAEELPGWGRPPRDAQTYPEVARFWRYAGTGGTNFRGLYAAFLGEARDLTGDPDLPAAVSAFEAVVASWTELVDHLAAHTGAPDRVTHLEEAAARLHAVADQEEAVLGRLLELARDRVRVR
ncbi:BtrH N-terminal domain-containing protein [Streptomyces sp. NPDC097107]|uniref:BtrH N-terminal domain-containing protein n=1 Tax=Streptomyces sp. NPDC097107 TaxID=3366089 RepID=UPI003823226F